MAPQTPPSVHERCSQFPAARLSSTRLGGSRGRVERQRISNAHRIARTRISEAQNCTAFPKDSRASLSSRPLTRLAAKQTGNRIGVEHAKEMDATRGAQTKRCRFRNLGVLFAGCRTAGDGERERGLATDAAKGQFSSLSRLLQFACAQCKPVACLGARCSMLFAKRCSAYRPIQEGNKSWTKE